MQRHRLSVLICCRKVASGLQSVGKVFLVVVLLLGAVGAGYEVRHTGTSFVFIRRRNVL